MNSICIAQIGKSNHQCIKPYVVNPNDQVRSTILNPDPLHRVASVKCHFLHLQPVVIAWQLQVDSFGHVALGFSQPPVSVSVQLVVSHPLASVSPARTLNGSINIADNRYAAMEAPDKIRNNVSTTIMATAPLRQVRCMALEFLKVRSSVILET